MSRRRVSTFNYAQRARRICVRKITRVAFRNIPHVSYPREGEDQVVCTALEIYLGTQPRTASWNLFGGGDMKRRGGSC